MSRAAWDRELMEMMEELEEKLASVKRRVVRMSRAASSP